MAAIILEVLCGFILGWVVAIAGVTKFYLGGHIEINETDPNKDTFTLHYDKPLYKLYSDKYVLFKIVHSQK